MQDAETIISKFGDQPVFSLTLKDFLTVTRSVIQRESKPQEDPVKYYNRRDIMQIFGVSYPTIIEHEKRGLLVSSRKVGHKFFYTQEDIEKYLTRIPKAPNCPVNQ